MSSSKRLGKSKSSSFSFATFNPEERNIATANRVGVKNEKSKKDLAVKQKGIINERKHDIVALKKDERVLKDKLNKLTQQQDKNRQERPSAGTKLSDEKIKQASTSKKQPSADTIKDENNKVVQFSSDSKATEDKSKSLGRTRSSSTSGGTKESVFGSAEIIKADKTNSRKLSQRPSMISPRNSLKATGGFDEEISKWRKIHHTRTLNARLKAIRPGGRRHNSMITLREAMDQNATMRKSLAYNPEEFTAEKAWEMLNCNYLRLTPTNVETLEEICSHAGYDVSTHPHKDPKYERESIFEQLRNEAKHTRKT